MSSWQKHTCNGFHYAYAPVVCIGHEDMAVCVHGHAMGYVEVGIGSDPIGNTATSTSTRTRERENRCPLTNQDYQQHPRQPNPPQLNRLSRCDNHNEASRKH
jgi:hypothetical protein